MAKSTKPETKMFNFDCTITVGDKELPIEVSMNLISGRRGLKAVVALYYFGIKLKDIRIIDDVFGNTLVAFPTRDYVTKQGENRTVSVFYPVGQFKEAINKVILECYKDALHKEGPVVSMLRKDISPKNARKTNKTSENGENGGETAVSEPACDTDTVAELAKFCRPGAA